MPYCYISKKNLNQREFDKDQNAHEKQEVEQKFFQYTTASSKAVHLSESVNEDVVMVDCCIHAILGTITVSKVRLVITTLTYLDILIRQFYTF